MSNDDLQLLLLSDGSAGSIKRAAYMLMSHGSFNSVRCQIGQTPSVVVPYYMLDVLCCADAAFPVAQRFVLEYWTHRAV